MNGRRRSALRRVAAPLPAGLEPGLLLAQPPTTRLGWLRLNPLAADERQTQGIPAALRRVGWVEDANRVIE